jgi:hypothetical protein
MNPSREVTRATREADPEPIATDPRAAVVAVVAELEDWAERLHAFAMVLGGCALEELTDDPRRSVVHGGMSTAYSAAAGMVQRRIAELRAGGAMLP